MNLEMVVVAAERGSTKVYNWDFAGSKWVNFSPTHKYSFIKIVQTKTLSGNEFAVLIEPDETNDKLRFHLPTDVQVTKTGDMIQFAVPDPQDPTGGKLIAIKFERKDLETLFTTTAGRRINGFTAIKPTGEGSSSGQRPNDLNKPPEVEKQRPVYENTFSTDRYDGSSYQSPTLPSTGTGGAGKIQPRQHPFTAAIPAKPAVETRSNRSGEIGQYHQQPIPPVNNLSKPDPSPPVARPNYSQQPPPAQYGGGSQDWRPVDRHHNEEGRGGGGGSRERYSAEMRGKESGEKRSSGERRSREFGQQNDRMGQHFNDRGGYDNQDRFQGDRDRYQGDRDRYQGDRDRYQGDRDRYQDKQQGYGGGGASYQNEQDRYHDDKRYQDYYQDDPRYQDSPRYRDDQGDSYQRGRDDYQGGRGYRDDRDPNRDRYQEGKRYGRDNWERQGENPQGYEQDRRHYNEQRYPRDPDYRHDPRGYERNEGRNEDRYDRGDWRPAGGGGGGIRRDNSNDEYYNDGYDERRRMDQRERGGGGGREYVDEGGRYGRRNQRDGRGGGGGQYREEEKRKKQQNQQQIEPLVKQAPTESLIDDTEIKTATQRLAESISTMNQSDSYDLLGYLFSLLQSEPSDMSLPTESLGKFSIKFEPGISVTPSGFKLELIVEPLHGKTFTVYPEVFTSDTIEKLKLDVQKGYKIPKECQYWVIGSQLAEDKQTVADLKLTKDTAVFVYVQHPHKAKVHKNAMKEVESQSKKPAPPVKGDAPPVQPRKNVPPPGGYSLEPPPQVPVSYDPPPRRNNDPPRRDDDAMFRGPVSMQPKKPPPVGAVPVMMPVPQRNDDERYRDFKPLPVPIEEDYQRRPDPRPPSPPPEPPGWACPSCTFKNLPYRPGCELCDCARPDDYQPPPNYVPTDTEKKFMNNNDLQELNNFLENEKLMQRQEAEKNYRDLLNTDAVPVVLNEEEFECPVCMTDIDPGDGIRLRDCLHMVCMDCLKGSILHSEEAQVKCPFVDDKGECEEYISEREIRKVLNDEELESFFKRGLRVAEATDPNSFHCKTADCPGFCFYEDEVNEFKCQNCDKLNCILCKAQHEGQNCQQYQDDLKIKAANDEAAKETQAMLEKMVTDGEAMHCPHCKIIVTKKIGCDWIRCVMCKTEMCWATKGPRWGPKGRGDISGGCKCGVNGARCHPNCRNCH